MSSSSGKAQVEPLAALAAVFAVGVGLALYAGALDTALATLESDRSLAPAAADRFVAAASTFGAVDPPLEDALAAARPTGHRLNVTLRTANASWTAGPRAPETARCERRRVGARVAPGRVRPARLEVCVWPAL
jgi:hypothetical protein